MWTRRALSAGAAAAVVTGCAIPSRKPPILVNLAQPGDLPPADAGADLDTGADLAGRVTAPVRINGQGPFDFVVDTGANRTVVTRELAEALQLPPQGEAPVHGIAGVEPSATALIDELVVGSVVSRRLRAPTLSRARLGCDGLLGVDVMRNRRVRLDFVRRSLTIDPSRAASGGPSAFDLRRTGSGALPQPTSREVTAPARYRFGQLIIIDADVAGRPVTAFLDSGSQSTVANLALRRLVLGDAADPKLRRYVTPLYSVTGQTAQGEVAVLPPLRVGGLTLRGMQAAFADLHVFDIWQLQSRPTVLIGVDVMKSFEAITLDFGRREVTFTLPLSRRAVP